MSTLAAVLLFAFISVIFLPALKYFGKILLFIISTVLSIIIFVGIVMVVIWLFGALFTACGALLFF